MSFGETITFGGTDYDGIYDDYSDADGPKVRMKTADVVSAGIAQGSVITVRFQALEVMAIRQDGVGTTHLLFRWDS